MKVVAMKKAATTSQTIGAPKPAVASSIVRVRVRTATPVATRATAPIGRGRRMIPAMVVTKMARSFHASGSTPTGTGRSHSPTPTRAVATSLPVRTVVIAGSSLIPSSGPGIHPESRWNARLCPEPSSAGLRGRHSRAPGRPGARSPPRALDLHEPELGMSGELLHRVEAAVRDLGAVQAINDLDGRQGGENLLDGLAKRRAVAHPIHPGPEAVILRHPGSLEHPFAERSHSRSFWIESNTSSPSREAKAP